MKFRIRRTSCNIMLLTSLLVGGCCNGCNTQDTSAEDIGLNVLSHDAEIRMTTGTCAVTYLAHKCVFVYCHPAGGAADDHGHLACGSPPAEWAPGVQTWEKP